jgi:hypothetical protein
VTVKKQDARIQTFLAESSELDRWRYDEGRGRAGDCLAMKRGQDAETNCKEISSVGEVEESREDRFRETPEDARG